MKLHWPAKRFNDLTLQELHDILRLRVDIFVVEQRCAYEEVDGRDPEARHVLGLAPDGRLIAYARILPPDEHGLPHVGRVVVSAAHRGHGIAEELMRRCIVVLRDVHGSARSGLAAQAHLERFYARHGYVRQGPDYPWDGIPHVDMLREAP